MHGPQTAPIARGCQGQTGTLTEGLTVLGHAPSRWIGKTAGGSRAPGRAAQKLNGKPAFSARRKVGRPPKTDRACVLAPTITSTPRSAALRSRSRHAGNAGRRRCASVWESQTRQRRLPKPVGDPSQTAPPSVGRCQKLSSPSGHDGFRNRSHSPHSLFACIKLRSPKSGRREKRTATSPIGGLVAVTRLERERGPEGEPGAVFSTPQCTRRRHHSKVNPPKRTRPADEGSGTTSIHSVPIRISSTCTEL